MEKYLPKVEWMHTNGIFCYRIKTNLERITSVFFKHAIEYGIEDLPLIVTYSEEPKFTNLPIYALPTSPDNNTFYKVERPIIGGVSIASANKFLGTLGYPVVKNNNASGTRGYIVASHLIPMNQTSTIYQPFQTNSSNYSIGNANNNQTKIDISYVVFSNIQPIIHVGKDPVLQNMNKRTSENKTKMVIYGGTNPSGEIRKYGGITGNTGGYHVAYAYNLTAPNIPGKIIDTVGIMNGTASVDGDSGGPVYMGMNVSLGNGVTDYQAFIIGSAFASATYNGEPVTLYTPRNELSYYLDLKPYVITGKYLT